jgi:ABC-type thiamine transport system ATPase subunit
MQNKRSQKSEMLVVLVSHEVHKVYQISLKSETVTSGGRLIWRGMTRAPWRSAVYAVDIEFVRNDCRR